MLVSVTFSDSINVNALGGGDTHTHIADKKQFQETCCIPAFGWHAPAEYFSFVTSLVKCLFHNYVTIIMFMLQSVHSSRFLIKILTLSKTSTTTVVYLLIGMYSSQFPRIKFLSLSVHMNSPINTRPSLTTTFICEPR